MNNFLTRSVTGLIYVGVIVGCISWGKCGVLILSILLSISGINEFLNMTRGGKRSFTVLMVDILGGLMIVGGLAGCSNPDGQSGIIWAIFIPLWLVWLVSRLILELYEKTGNPLKNISLSVMSQIYVALPIGLLNALYYAFPHGSFLLLMFVLIWLNDTGAYIFGCSFGKHRLFPSVSPKKSWEGFVGGLIFALGGSIAARFIFPQFFSAVSLLGWGLYGLLVCVFSTWGDLVESLLKRSLGVKDSGRLLPGHGGILDRIDSLLLVSPVSLLFFIFYSVISGLS